MKFRQSIKEKSILECLEKNWDFNIKSIRFLPIGAASWNYKLEDAAGRVWFIKLVNEVNQASAIVPSQLSTQGLNFIVPAVKDKENNYWQSVKDFKILVYPFMEAKELMGNEDRERYDNQIGNLLKNLHGSKHIVDKDILDLLPREDFRKFQNDTYKILKKVKDNNFKSTLKVKLARLIKNKMTVIERILDKAKGVGAGLREETKEFVICHADIHYANILLDEADGLHFIDWDGVMLAPPERDLMFYSKNLGLKDAFYGGYDKTFSYNSEAIK